MLTLLQYISDTDIIDIIARYQVRQLGVVVLVIIVDYLD